MRNYEAPTIKVVEFEAADIIQTSGTLNSGGNTTLPGTGVVVPTSNATSLDNNYDNNY